MSLGDILKNVYNFLKVLKSCSSSEVANWDKNSVNNAFKWAQFSEKLYTQSQGKSYQTELDEKIRQLGHHTGFIFNTAISLQFMKDAQKVVFQVLIQNEHLKQEAFQFLVDRYVFSAHESDRAKFFKYSFEVAQTKNSIEIANVVHGVAFGEDRPHLTAAANETQAVLLLNQISHVLENCRDVHKTEEHLSHILEKYIHDTASMEILLQSFLLNEDVFLRNATECQDAILSWLLPKLCDEKSSCYKNVWLVRPPILCRFAEQQLQFFNIYMTYLRQMASEVSPLPIDRITIRPALPGRDLYKNFLAHFKALWKGAEHIRSAVEMTLNNLIENDDKIVWTDVLKDLKESDK